MGRESQDCGKILVNQAMSANNGSKIKKTFKTCQAMKFRTPLLGRCFASVPACSCLRERKLVFSNCRRVHQVSCEGTRCENISADTHRARSKCVRPAQTLAQPNVGGSVMRACLPGTSWWVHCECGSLDGSPRHTISNRRHCTSAATSSGMCAHQCGPNPANSV